MRRQRGDRLLQGHRRRAPRSGRESRPSEPSPQHGQSPRLPAQSVATGNGRATGSTPAGARRPRVLKKKCRPRSSRSDEVQSWSEETSRSEEVTQTEAVILKEEVTQTEELTQTEDGDRSGEMAAAGLSVTVTHSNEKYDLLVTPKEGCSEPLVQDLAQVVEEATGVPLCLQKLIYKGKSLKDLEQPLSALGIQDGCRIMLIGKKTSPEEAELKKLKDLEKCVDKIAGQLDGLNEDLSGLQQGFLIKDLRAEALCKLSRRVKATIEQFMKILEEIDALILPENFKDSRLKRKTLVVKIQAFLAECDRAEQTICQETEQP